MITQCSYCNLSTSGEHESGCPSKASTRASIYSPSALPDGTKGYFVAYDKCDFCHEQSPFTMTFPYGSAFDGWMICAECIQKHIEPALREFLMK